MSSFKDAVLAYIDAVEDEIGYCDVCDDDYTCSICAAREELDVYLNDYL